MLFRSACVSAIPVCSDNTGGLDCCPQSCTTAFSSELSRSSAERALEVLVSGECIDGLATFIDEFGPMESVLQ